MRFPPHHATARITLTLLVLLAHLKGLGLLGQAAPVLHPAPAAQPVVRPVVRPVVPPMRVRVMDGGSPSPQPLSHEGRGALKASALPPPLPSPQSLPLPSWEKAGERGQPLNHDTTATITPPATTPVQLPGARQLHYRITHGSSRGEGWLDWRPQGERYQLSQRSQVGTRPAMAWHSQGQLAPDGISPLRLEEHRRERAVQAVNFQRDKALLSFSGTPHTLALAAGVQDRASWLIQLAGMLRARQGQLVEGETLRLSVAAPRGLLDHWDFQLASQPDRSHPPYPPSALPAPHLLHLRREPQRPYDLRVDIWLDAQLDYLPRRLIWQNIPGGEPVLWELEDDGAAAEPAAAVAHCPPGASLEACPTSAHKEFSDDS